MHHFGGIRYNVLHSIGSGGYCSTTVTVSADADGFDACTAQAVVASRWAFMRSRVFCMPFTSDAGRRAIDS